MDPATISGIASIASGVFGLFGGGKKKKDKTPRDNLLSQAQGAREASEKYGFNPLTMMQYGQTGGAMAGSGGAAPLASLQMLTDGLKGLDDIVSGDRARRRAADDLEIDLARLRLEQMRSGVVIQDRTAREGIGNGPSPLGRNAATVLPGGTPARYSSPSYSTMPPGDNPNADHPFSDTLGVYSVPEPTLDRGSGIFIGGTRIEPPPGWSTGEQFEQEFGEGPLSWPYHAGLMGATAMHNRYLRPTRMFDPENPDDRSRYLDYRTGRFGVPPDEYQSPLRRYFQKRKDRH